MVEGEFDAIWAQVEAELKREGKTAADEGKTEDELKAEYRDIAERRVRLGLVLGKLGEQNGITVAGDEVQRAIMAARAPVPRPGTAGVPVSTPTIRRPRPKSARRCSRTRWWISSPNWPRSRTSKVDRETLFLDPDDAAGRARCKNGLIARIGFNSR